MIGPLHETFHLPMNSLPAPGKHYCGALLCILAQRFGLLALQTKPFKLLQGSGGGTVSMLDQKLLKISFQFQNLIASSQSVYFYLHFPSTYGTCLKEETRSSLLAVISHLIP